MIHIKIVAVGNLKEDFWQAAENEYKKRLKKFCDLQIVEIAEQNILSDVEKIKNPDTKASFLILAADQPKFRWRG